MITQTNVLELPKEKNRTVTRNCHASERQYGLFRLDHTPDMLRGQRGMQTLRCQHAQKSHLLYVLTPSMSEHAKVKEHTLAHAS